MKFNYWALSFRMSSTVQIKKVVCKGLPFCANNVWNDGVVLMCVQSTT